MLPAFSSIDINVLGEPVPVRGYAEAYYWQSLWLPYTKNSQVFFCPSSTEDFRQAPRYKNGYKEIWGQYGINYEGLCKRRTPYFLDRFDSMPKPAETFLVLDSWCVSLSVDGADSPKRALGCGAVGSTDDVGIGFNLPKGDTRRGDRHSGMVNVAYCDGHVKSVPGPKLVKELILDNVLNEFTAFKADAGVCADQSNYPQ